VKVKVLTAACGLAVALVAGLVAANGGARLVYLVLHPEVAQALEDAENTGATTAPTAPATPAPAEPAPASAAPSAPPSAPVTAPSVAPVPAP
jgi:hypothetical protein